MTIKEQILKAQTTQLTTLKSETESLYKRIKPKQELKQLWELVKDEMERNKNELDEYNTAKATLIINYGDNGWNKQGIVDHSDSLPTMLMKVLEYYHALKGIKK